MPFVEELTCVGLMVLSILGAATASKRGAHLGLSVLTDLLPKTAQSVIRSSATYSTPPSAPASSTSATSWSRTSSTTTSSAWA